MRNLTLALSTAALLATPALAVQQGPARQAQTISLSVLQSRAQAQFARTDLNGDGFVSRTEAKPQAGNQPTRAARKATREQRQAKRAQRLARLDANRDGIISATERPNAASSSGVGAAKEAKRAERQATRAQRRTERQAQMGKRTLHINEKRFDRLDTNRDARLSLTEVIVRVGKRFERLDANRDGALSREERRTARSQRQARKG